MTVEVVSQSCGKIKIMSGPFEIIFERNGSSVKRIYFFNHEDCSKNYIPKKYSEPAKEKAIDVLCRNC